MGAAEGSEEADRLEVLAILVEAYERRHYPVAAPSPVEAIKFRLEQTGLSRKDLEPMIGSRARVSEVLGGKRRLTLAMIRRLSKGLGIPAALLVGEEPSGPRTTARGRK
jgi:HTH-type transcriptional regulator/antitoxin HigA